MYSTVIIKGASFYFSELGKLEEIGFKKLFQRYKAKGMFGTPLFEIIVISATIEFGTPLFVYIVLWLFQCMR